jgi:hypothetical protein
MYRSTVFRLTGARRLAALLVLAAAAACSDGPTGSNRPPVQQPGGQKPPAVASVEIDPGTLQLPVEGYRNLSVKLRALGGAVITGRTVTWSSSDPTVVRVDESGNVTALRVGTAVITAVSESKQGQATVEVIVPTPTPVAYVVITGGGDIEPGESRMLNAELRAENGTVLYGRAVTWRSSDSSVVRVLEDGHILGLKGGTATITATSEGKSSSVTLVIPAWLRFDLRTVAGQTLPAVTEFSADTTNRTEYGMLVTEYRQRVSWGSLWFSTLDSRYHQRYIVETWKREVSYLNGSFIIGAEERISSREVRDEGRAELYDVWTGEPIYASTTFGNHSFRAYRTEDRGRQIHQRLPGTTEQSFDMVFAK